MLEVVSDWDLEYRIETRAAVGPRLAASGRAQTGGAPVSGPTDGILVRLGSLPD